MTGSRTHSVGTRPEWVTGVGRIVMNTSDLSRFRAFYEGLLGLPHVISLRMQDPPFLVFGVFAIGPHTALQAVEVPGFDAVADRVDAGGGRGEWIDHVALLVDDETALRDLRDRLVAAGASDGVVRAMGPYLSVGFRDPDGCEGAVTCPDLAFDPTRSGDEVLECSIGPTWTSELLARPRRARDLDASD
jgi:catechol 2,3-dioxygenase-like lactoylglutathione lyase family enzyme